MKSAIELPSQNNFRDYVTSASFFLSLSKRQIEMIHAIEEFGGSWGYSSTANALAAKGLITWELGVAPPSDSPPISPARRVVLTDAGRAVIPLLKLAGLYTEVVPWHEGAQVDGAIPKRELVGKLD